MQVYCLLHNTLIPTWTQSYLDSLLYLADYNSVSNETTEPYFPCKLIVPLFQF